MAGQCSIAECERPTKARGVCGAHLERIREGRSLDTPIRTRTFASTPNAAGCWIWDGYVDARTGYGKWGSRWAHRVAYDSAVGPIPPGYQIDHLCRVRLCVRPDHLEAVSQRENILRSEAPNAVAVRTNRCKRGHEFTPENTYRRPDNGYRQCRKCSALRVARRGVPA